MNDLRSLKARYAELKSKTRKEVEMKTKIIDLINQRNSKGEKIFNFSPSFLTTKPWKYSSEENMRYYLWLCQLQKWIREKYEMWIYVIPHTYEDIKRIEWTNNLDMREDIFFSDFEEALESGIYKILIILIKNNGKNN